MSSLPVQDEYAIYRMQLGAWMRDRLSRTPGAFQIPAPGLDLFVVRDFLDARECAALVRKIDADRQPSGLLGAYEPEFRTSESCNLRVHDPIVKTVERKISLLMGIDPKQGETIQGQRYAVGQQFKPHHDFFFVNEPYWPEQERIGGQRTWTAMVFLNEPEAGGQTGFPNVDVKVTPRTGNLLAWNNMDEFGMPNPKSLHTGMPVEAGTKYVITKWYRERPWIY